MNIDTIEELLIDEHKITLLLQRLETSKAGGPVRNIVCKTLEHILCIKH